MRSKKNQGRQIKVGTLFRDEKLLLDFEQMDVMS